MHFESVELVEANHSSSLCASFTSLRLSFIPIHSLTDSSFNFRANLIYTTKVMHSEDKEEEAN